MSRKERRGLAWVTWFPAPYWNVRFVALARRPELDFRALFLSDRSPEHAWELGAELFAFPHEYVPMLFPNRVPMGKRRFGPPLWGVRALGTLVLPYPEVDLVLTILARRALGMRTLLFTDNTIFDARSWSALNEFTKRLVMSSSDGILVGGRAQT